jgi:hypothetical protein
MVTPNALPINICRETLIETVSDPTQPHILFIKDIESLFFTPSFKQLHLKKLFNKITAPLFIIGNTHGHHHYL